MEHTKSAGYVVCRQPSLLTYKVFIALCILWLKRADGSDTTAFVWSDVSIFMNTLFEKLLSSLV